LIGSSPNAQICRYEIQQFVREVASMADAMPFRAKAFIALTAASGIAVLCIACMRMHSDNLLKFGCFVLIAVMASTMKVKLPGMSSTMSVNFLFVFLGVLELSLAETLVIGCIATLVQSLWKCKNQPDPVKVIFNLFSLTSNAIFLTYLAYHYMARSFENSVPLLLLVVALTYFMCNSVPLATVIALVEGCPLRKMWKETYFWALPYNLAGAALVGVIHVCNHYFGWQNALLILPIMYGVHRSFQLYLDRLDEQKKRVEIEALQVAAEKLHVEQVCALHLRTIEGLALAIDAKDHTTHEHLHRVRVYAAEIAKELGLSELELDALNAVALLHDIGKLAVPDHIINKPGRLTPEEFEKMKIHPIVGADILERVAFPYPVAPIVRSHHEKWDGTGYPDGLKGEEIPIGARILAAVDCLDAVASDRQYRKALALDEAVQLVIEESGISYDPKIIEILARRYRELEAAAVLSLVAAGKNKHNFCYNVERGGKPGAGFEISLDQSNHGQVDFLSSIASARQEAHTLFELSQDLGNSLSLDETLSLVAMRLRKLVPYDSIVAFIRKGDYLVSEFVSGDYFKFLSSLEIPVGTGLCGWVAQNSKPIVNGNPDVDPGFVHDRKQVTGLRSALAVPLEGVTGLVGVLTLYQADLDAFTNDHLRILQVITSKVALFIENALKYRQAENSATNDYLTGMPNARALSIHLERELARCKREHSSVAVMVCDLDGFKLINDRYGHMAGDKVLKLFSNLMQSVCREYDYAARMGGDEFVIIAPGMSPGSVSERAILLNALAQEAGREVCGKDLLSLSLGAAFYPQDGSDAEQLLTEADRKMYVAKKLHYDLQDKFEPVIAQYSQAASVN
jgi:diguanylate cyclase (GGDEF)-like protein/putative nucleotidyltransferase with HDIG domain